MKLSESPHLLEITGVNLVELVKRVYDGSVPAGMGLIHYEAGELTDEEAKALIREARCNGDAVVNMDYVKGRCCKFTVWEEDGRHFVPRKWHDHTDNHYIGLLGAFGVTLNECTPHGIACHCINCQDKRSHG